MTTNCFESSLIIGLEDPIIENWKFGGNSTHEGWDSRSSSGIGLVSSIDECMVEDKDSEGLSMEGEGLNVCVLKGVRVGDWGMSEGCGWMERGWFE